MSQKVYPPNIVVKVIRDAFFKYRNLVAAPRSLSRDVEISNFDDDRVISDMEQFYYVRLDALRITPRGNRDWVVVLILGADGKYSHHSPDLRKLIESIETERPAKEGRLDEIILIAEENFFSRKNLTDVIRESQNKQVGGPDLIGKTSFYNAYPYYNFALIVPDHKSVPLHRIMTGEEVTQLLQREHVNRNDFAIVFTSDAPIVWNGAREGQIVEIIRDSETAGISLFYRRVERA